MSTKKVQHNDESLELLLLKSANEALEYTRGQRELRSYSSTKIEKSPINTKDKIKNED